MRVVICDDNPIEIRNNLLEIATHMVKVWKAADVEFEFETASRCCLNWKISWNLLMLCF